MTNNDELAQLKQLATFMTERFSMNPVSCKILNEDWKKRFPDDAAVAEAFVTLLAERDADKKRIAELEERTVSVKLPAVYDLVGDCDGNGNLNEAEMVASSDGIYARVSDLAAAGIKLEVGE